MIAIFDEFEIFNSTFFYNWSENELFNQIANFFQHFQQYLHLYCESKLLDLLIIALIDSVDTWFDDQSKFISLHDFDTVLTNAFFSFIFIALFNSFFSISASELICEIVEKSTKSCSLSSQKQQKLKIKSEISKFKKILKAKRIAKSTSIVQNIDIFDSIFTNENRRFSDFAKFLQYFQHCQHLYRKSNLLVLLFICFDDVAFIICYNKRNVMTSTSLNEWIKILRIEFVIFAKLISTMICMRCDQNFNIKKTFREHVREQHAKKFVKSFCFDVNTINFVCEIEKKSFVSQKSHESLTKSQKSKFEFAITFETVISLKRSNFLLFALKIESKSTKKSTTCRHCKQIFNLKKMFRQHKREQHAKKFVVNSFFSIDTIKSICESIKTSTINSSFSVSFVVQSNELFLFAFFDIFNSTRFHQNSEKKRFNQIVIFIQYFQQCQHLYDKSKLFE